MILLKGSFLNDDAMSLLHLNGLHRHSVGLFRSYIGLTGARGAVMWLQRGVSENKFKDTVFVMTASNDYQR